MPVPTAINALSVLAGDNPPDGGVETPVTMDNHVRQVYGFLAELYNGATLTGISGTNTLTGTAPLSISAYEVGQRFYWIAETTNTGPVTFNFNGLGADSILRGTAELSAGDITTGCAIMVMRDADNFQLICTSAPTGVITSDLVINVPADYATLAEAFESLESRFIAPSATVSILLADGTYDHEADTLQLNHPNGERIQIVGNQTTPTNCIMDFGDSLDNGITVTRGHVLGLLDGVHVKHNSQKLVTHGDNWNSSSTGILANDGAIIFLGEKVVVSDFFYPIAAKQNSHVECQYAVVYNGGDVGIWAYLNSFVDASYADVSACQNDDNGFGSGVTVEYNSTVMATSIVLHDNNFNGITCRSNSSVRAKTASIHSNGRDGVFTSVNGLVQIGGSNIYGNGGWGINPTDNSYIAETGEATFVGAANVLGNIANNVISDHRTDGSARLIPTEIGDLYISVKSGSSIFFNTALDNTSAKIEHAASSVNALTMKGSGTGNAVSVYPTGSDTNVNLDLLGKGSGCARTQAATTGKASLNIPHGTAPSAPVNGDVWTTTAGLFVRINGVTVGPLS